jgi:hypothetical protein
MPDQIRVMDEEMLLFDAVASGWFTVANHDSTAVDLGAADVDKEVAGEVVVFLSGMTSGGSATVQLILIDCDTVGGTYAALTPVGVQTAAVAYNDASWSDRIRMPLPKFGVRQFLKLRVTIGTAALTAGTITAAFIRD